MVDAREGKLFTPDPRKLGHQNEKKTQVRPFKTLQLIAIQPFTSNHHIKTTSPPEPHCTSTTDPFWLQIVSINSPELNKHKYTHVDLVSVLLLVSISQIPISPLKHQISTPQSTLVIDFSPILSSESYSPSLCDSFDMYLTSAGLVFSFYHHFRTFFLS